MQMSLFKYDGSRIVDRSYRLIPTSRVYVSETHAPAGWHVAAYDSEGYTREGARWFPDTKQGSRDALSHAVRLHQRLNNRGMK